MNCPKCNSTMIERKGNSVRAVKPPQYFYYWWCGCGHTEDSGWRSEETELQKARRIWESLNQDIT